MSHLPQNLEDICVGKNEYILHPTINRSFEKLHENDEYIDERLGKIYIDSEDSSYEFLDKKIVAGSNVYITKEDGSTGKRLRIDYAPELSGNLNVEISGNTFDEHISVFHGDNISYIKDSGIHKDDILDAFDNYDERESGSEDIVVDKRGDTLMYPGQFIRKLYYGGKNNNWSFSKFNNTDFINETGYTSDYPTIFRNAAFNQSFPSANLFDIRAENLMIKNRNQSGVNTVWRFDGLISPEVEGNYKFRLRIDDTCRVYVKDMLTGNVDILIQNVGNTTKEFSYVLKNDRVYWFFVPYYVWRGANVIKLVWKIPGSTTWEYFPSYWSMYLHNQITSNAVIV